MYIYFKFNGETFVVPDVNLHDGYLPMVGKVGGDLKFIEPGIWFKTLIIDSVLVECDFKVLRWMKSNDCLCPLSPEERASMSLDKQLEVLGLKESTESSQCMEFDSEVDDLFHSARAFFENRQILPLGASVCMRVEPDIEDHLPSKFNQEILRLVHCYILPSINLTLDDSPSLKTALQCIEVCLKNVETEILQKDKAISLTESSLRKQRDGFLKDPKFERESYIRECSVDFLKSFLHHLEKDIQQEAEQMQKCQIQVNKLRDIQGNHVKEQLDRARKERDKVHQVLIEMQMMRENIKNVVVRQQIQSSRKRRSRKISVKVFHEIYLEITMRLRSEKETMHKLILRKVKIASVREAICLALGELDTVGHSLGWQSLYDGACSSTDVGILSTKPKEWTTIGERVSSVVNSGDVQHQFHHFCENILQKIDGSMDEANFLAQLSEDGQDPECEGFVNICTHKVCFPDINANKNKLLSSQHDQSKPVLNYEEGAVYHPSTLPLHSLMDSVKSEIKKHMDEICKRIIYILRQEDLRENLKTRQKSNKDTYKNVWLCYESHLYERIYVKLNILYENRYKRKSTNLAEKLVGVSMNELGIDDPWLEMVSKPEDWENTEAKVPLSDMDSITLRNPGKSGEKRQDQIKKLSNTLGAMSIDRLYRYANRELEDMGGIDDFPFIENEEDDIDSELLYSPQGGNQRNEVNNIEPHTPEFHLPPYEEVPKMLLGAEVSFSDTEVLTSDGRMQSLSSEESVRRFSSNIEEVIKVAPVNLKIKNITKAFKFVAKEVSKLKVDSSPPGCVYLPCADDMLTVIIVMLTLLEKETFTKLYAHLNMILDLMPPFMNGSEHDCALMNFHIAFQYLFDRHVLNQSRSSRELDL